MRVLLVALGLLAVEAGAAESAIRHDKSSACRVAAQLMLDVMEARADEPPEKCATCWGGTARRSVHAMLERYGSRVVLSSQADFDDGVELGVAMLMSDATRGYLLDQKAKLAARDGELARTGVTLNDMLASGCQQFTERFNLNAKRTDICVVAAGLALARFADWNAANTEADKTSIAEWLVTNGSEARDYLTAQRKSGFDAYFARVPFQKGIAIGVGASALGRNLEPSTLRTRCASAFP